MASPAVPWSSPPLRAAARLQVPVESEITLASRLLSCPWLGVTGTNGKSTTAMLAARGLETTGRARSSSTAHWPSARERISISQTVIAL